MADVPPPPSTERPGSGRKPSGSKHTTAAFLATAGVLASVVAGAWTLVRLRPQAPTVWTWSVSSADPLDEVAGVEGTLAEEGPTAEAAETTVAAMTAADDGWKTLLEFDAEGRADERGPATREIPPEERWEFSFGGGLTEGPYARMLDSLEIELGVLMDDGQIEYVSDLSEVQMIRRRGAAVEEDRLYLSWRGGELGEADRSLLRKAGIDAGDQVILHFLSPETESQLLELERSYRDRDPASILKTRFGLRRNLRGYEPYVIEQVERTGS